MRRLMLLPICLLVACQHTPTKPVPLPVILSDAPPGARSTYLETTELLDVANVLAALPRKQTLVVFDIDDTLLSTPFVEGNSGPRVLFGSDTWFNWQSGLGSPSPHRQPCLYQFLGINYEAATFAPTEHAAAAVGAVEQDQLFLTSRSSAYRGGTERELTLAKIPLPKPRWPKAAFAEFVGDRLTTYANGILMTQGACMDRTHR